MANLRVSVECDGSSIKEPEVSETERIKGAHRPVREEWPAISVLEKLSKIFHIFFYRINFEDTRSFMFATEKNSVNVYFIQVFNYQGQYTVSIPERV